MADTFTFNGVVLYGASMQSGASHGAGWEQVETGALQDGTIETVAEQGEGVWVKDGPKGPATYQFRVTWYTTGILSLKNYLAAEVGPTRASLVYPYGTISRCRFFDVQFGRIRKSGAGYLIDGTLIFKEDP